ncbi:MAG: DUF6279 family lipoprotein [Xanthomonadales bacterium]|nr:DUF6279 family lipoprotein [Xanthomonadales bacterium]
MKSLSKLVFTFLAIITLAGCTTSFAYNRLDWLIPWWVDGYVDLTGEQKESLRDQLMPVLQWHRQEELARYQEILDQLEAGLKHPVAADQVKSWSDELFQASQRVEQSMLKLALEFGATISDQQISEFIVSMEEQQVEFEDEFLSRTDEEYSKENAKNLGRLLERLLGRLSPDQKDRLLQVAQAMQRFDAVWLEDRRQWLDQLQPLLARQVGWQKKIMQAYVQRESNRPPQYAQILEYNMRVISQAIADVLNTRSAKQNSHAAREFNELRETLEKLMRYSDDTLDASVDSALSIEVAHIANR